MGKSYPYEDALSLYVDVSYREPSRERHCCVAVSDSGYLELKRKVRLVKRFY